MRFNTVVTLIFLAAVPGAQPAQAQGAAQRPAVSLESLYQQALARDPGVRSAMANSSGARELVDAAAGALRPQATLSLGQYYNHLDTVIDIPASSTSGQSSRHYGSNSQSLAIRQSLWAPADAAQVDLARYRVAETEAAIRQAKLDLSVRLTEAWAEGLQAAIQWEQNEALNTANRNILAAANQALTNGQGTRTDIAEAEARLEIAVAQREQIERARERARFRVASLTGADTSGLFADATNPETGVGALPKMVELDEWLLLAERHNPAIAGAMSRHDQARAAVDAARGRQQPIVILTGQLSQGQSETIDRLGQQVRQASVGVQINIPLSTGGTLDARLRAAQADELRARELLDGQRLDLRLAMQDQHRVIATAPTRLTAMRQIVQALQQLLTSAQQGRTAGTRTMLDVLTAQQRLAGGERDLRSAAIDVLVARIRLLALSGTLEPSALSLMDARRTPAAD